MSSMILCLGWISYSFAASPPPTAPSPQREQKLLQVKEAHRTSKVDLPSKEYLTVHLKYPPFQYDAGASIAVSGLGTFFESNLGGNYNLNGWLTFRSAPYFRYSSRTTSNKFGLDISFRARGLLITSARINPHIHVGIGYRMENTNNHSSFVEAGAVIHLGSINGLVNVKWLLGSKLFGTRSSELIFTLGISDFFGEL